MKDYLTGIRVDHYFKKLKKFDKNTIVLTLVALGVALAVFSALLYANLGFLNIVGYFESHDIYADKLVLFFHEECAYCTKVDTYIRDNRVDKKIEFTRLDVFNSEYNKNELADKAQICGLNFDEIGVPFLWDGQNKKCVLGYVDIINFFYQQMAKKAK